MYFIKETVLQDNYKEQIKKIKKKQKQEGEANSSIHYILDFLDFLDFIISLTTEILDLFVFSKMTLMFLSRLTICFYCLT